MGHGSVSIGRFHKNRFEVRSSFFFLWRFPFRQIHIGGSEDEGVHPFASKPYLMIVATSNAPNLQSSSQHILKNLWTLHPFTQGIDWRTGSHCFYLENPRNMSDFRLISCKQTPLKTNSGTTCPKLPTLSTPQFQPLWSAASHSFGRHGILRQSAVFLDMVRFLPAGYQLATRNGVPMNAKFLKTDTCTNYTDRIAESARQWYLMYLAGPSDTEACFLVQTDIQMSMDKTRISKHGWLHAYIFD